MLKRVIKRCAAVIREEYAWFKIRVDFKNRTYKIKGAKRRYCQREEQTAWQK